jgi:transposase
MNTNYLFVDKTALEKGHEYVTLLSNHEGHVLAVFRGHLDASSDASLTQLPADALRQTQSICMDMSPAYIKAEKKALPNAYRKIAFDHFHVVKMLTEAVNRIRKDELFRLAPSAHRTRFYWLKRRDNLSEADRETVNKLIPAMINTVLAWYFREQARNIWHGNSVRGTKQRWKDWIALAKASGLKPLMAVADTIENKLWGILNAMHFGLSNG